MEGLREPFVLAIGILRIPYVVCNRLPRYTAYRFVVCEEHRGFAVNRSFAAAGDVVHVGDYVGGMSPWCCEELGSSIVDNVRRVLFFFHFTFIEIFEAVSHVLLFFRSLL